jgi:hypothetical protein
MESKPRRIRRPYGSPRPERRSDPVPPKPDEGAETDYPQPPDALRRVSDAAAQSVDPAGALILVTLRQSR